MTYIDATLTGAKLARTNSAAHRENTRVPSEPNPPSNSAAVLHAPVGKKPAGDRTSVTSFAGDPGARVVRPRQLPRRADEERKPPAAAPDHVFAGTDNPRMLRLLIAFSVQGFGLFKRALVERISGATNGPDLIMRMRRQLGLQIKCMRLAIMDADGRISYPGCYFLTQADRLKVRDWLAQPAVMKNASLMKPAVLECFKALPPGFSESDAAEYYEANFGTAPLEHIDDLVSEHDHEARAAALKEPRA